MLQHSTCLTGYFSVAVLLQGGSLCKGRKDLRLRVP